MHDISSHFSDLSCDTYFSRHPERVTVRRTIATVEYTHGRNKAAVACGLCNYLVTATPSDVVPTSDYQHAAVSHNSIPHPDFLASTTRSRDREDATICPEIATVIAPQHAAGRINSEDFKVGECNEASAQIDVRALQTGAARFAGGAGSLPIFDDAPLAERDPAGGQSRDNDGSVRACAADAHSSPPPSPERAADSVTAALRALTIRRHALRAAAYAKERLMPEALFEHRKATAAGGGA
jgi:hypothetical protein